MYHIAEADVWNLPFVNVPQLDIFRYDGVMIAVGCLLLIFFCGFFYKPNKSVQHGWANLLEVFVLFIRNQIAIAFLGEKDGRRMAPLFCSFFFFILILNLLGLVPLFTTATGNINVTGALAAITLGFMVGGGIYRCGVKNFLLTFIPPGLPLPLKIFMAPLEFVSMISKVMALMIRLFANMLAGHIIIFSLVGLVALFGLWAAPVLALVVCVYFFEIFIAFFQAYIFTLLSAVYMGQLYRPEH
ncbi:MAG: ATP synthase F0 subunit A [Lentisphaerae bacterium GWF2_57_35]|nr:MAG: ATP synthase F0 subunit A [Lentisphaerae bacterium GWF2_57_35]